MKYENTKVKGISKNTLRELEKIAMDACPSLKARGGIDTRNNDEEDFIDSYMNINMYSIQTMLEKAYLLGKADSNK